MMCTADAGGKSRKLRIDVRGRRKVKYATATARRAATSATPATPAAHNKNRSPLRLMPVLSDAAKAIQPGAAAALSSPFVGRRIHRCRQIPSRHQPHCFIILASPPALTGFYPFVKRLSMQAAYPSSAIDMMCGSMIGSVAKTIQSRRRFWNSRLGVVHPPGAKVCNCSHWMQSPASV